VIHGPLLSKYVTDYPGHDAIYQEVPREKRACTTALRFDGVGSHLERRSMFAMPFTMYACNSLSAKRSQSMSLSSQYVVVLIRPPYGCWNKSVMSSSRTLLYFRTYRFRCKICRIRESQDHQKIVHGVFPRYARTLVCDMPYLIS
jgi:hypothetical protein